MTGLFRIRIFEKRTASKRARHSTSIRERSGVRDFEKNSRRFECGICTAGLMMPPAIKGNRNNRGATGKIASLGIESAEPRVRATERWLNERYSVIRVELCI